MVNKQYSATDLEAFMKIAANWQNNNHNLLEGVDIKGEMQQYINNPAMNMYKKRERTQNWNHQEKKFLLELCRKDMRIIENKRLDAGLTAVKNKAWKIIHQKFSNAFGTDRTCNRLKEQWRRMKACTRNEILDYNNRLTRFGAEVADRKKPSPFTFEVWNFMQEAKKACKSEALDGIDYSKIPLALEEDFEYREEENQQDDDNDMDDSRTPPQELCDVDIKDETIETLNDTYNDSLLNGATGGGGVGGGGGSIGGASGGGAVAGAGGIGGGSGGLTNSNNNISSLTERLSTSPHQRSSLMDSHDSERGSVLHSPGHASLPDHVTPSGFLPQNPNDINFQPAFNMNNISATLEALNALRSGQFPSAAAAAAAALQNNFAAAAHQQHQQQQQHQQLHHHQQHHPQHLPQQRQLQHQQEQQQSSPSDEPAAKRLCTSSSTCGSHEELLNNSSSSTNACASNGAVPASYTNYAELRAFMEMQTKEHMLRMKILEVQLQAAKYSRDIVEINKTLALQKLQEFASKRMS